LALASPPQLFQELLKLGDPTLLFLDLTLLLSHSAAKLRVLLKDFLVTRHVYRVLDHARKEDSSPCGRAPRRDPRGTGASGR
jgi:hypothetical protein